ncbi:transmembrane signal receptor [Lithospermum erythrorhizon]|uniref:Transmembrane signal receptor n=1 Tax=Lithospermum erythrorhizon TaxID=34254 RepID=A0AAV3QZ96_LITER
MCEEINAMIRTNTLSLVPPTSSMNIVGCRWVFRLKRDSNGNVTRRRARLVAKGNHQLSGIDFTETFSPVIKTATIHTILSIVVSFNWPLRQIDIQNAFLHGTLDETVYMVQPPGFVDERYPNYACKLHKSLYGLKQAPRAWFNCLQEFLLSYGFLQSKADTSLFVFSRAALSSRFVTRDLGDFNFFLGIEAVKHSDGALLLSQK